MVNLIGLVAALLIATAQATTALSPATTADQSMPQQPCSPSDLGCSWSPELDVEPANFQGNGSQETQAARNTHERTKLLERMDRSRGQWNEHHPRHRLLDALHGFSKYEERQNAELSRLQGLFKHVSKAAKMRLNKVVGYSKKFTRAKQTIAENQQLHQEIVKTALEFYKVGSSELEEHIKQAEARGKKAELTSVSQALKHIARDWADAGADDRAQAFPCILQTMADLFQGRRDGDSPVQVLLPGAGLGRLGHDISRLGGFEVTNNEWSMYMNILYRFLENHGQRYSHSVQPFIDTWSHQARASDMFRSISFPDTSIDSKDALLVEGDFTTVFKEQTGVYDAIVTHFFIDTARNLMAYFETIQKLLKPGGYWINMGPLLYGSAPFVQLSLEEIVQVVEDMEFSFVATDAKRGNITLPGKKVRTIEAQYGFDDLSLHMNIYKNQFWVAQRS